MLQVDKRRSTSSGRTTNGWPRARATGHSASNIAGHVLADNLRQSAAAPCRTRRAANAGATLFPRGGWSAAWSGAPSPSRATRTWSSLEHLYDDCIGVRFATACFVRRALNALPQHTRPRRTEVPARTACRHFIRPSKEKLETRISRRGRSRTNTWVRLAAQWSSEGTRGGHTPRREAPRGQAPLLLQIHPCSAFVSIGAIEL